MSFRSLFPTVRAQEDEIVDPQVVLREKCGNTSHCAELKTRLNTCNERVNSRSNTAEICTEEVIDFMHCIDHCTAKTLFSVLK